MQNNNVSVEGIMIEELSREIGESIKQRAYLSGKLALMAKELQDEKKKSQKLQQRLDLIKAELHPAGSADEQRSEK